MGEGGPFVYFYVDAAASQASGLAWQGSKMGDVVLEESMLIGFFWLGDSLVEAICRRNLKRRLLL